MQRHPFNTSIAWKGEVTRPNTQTELTEHGEPRQFAITIVVYRSALRAQCAREKNGNEWRYRKRAMPLHRSSIDCAFIGCVFCSFRFNRCRCSMESGRRRERQNNICYNNNFVFVLVLKSLKIEISIDS